MKQRISTSLINDDDKLWPLRAFFNAIPDERFVSTIRDMVHGLGGGFDDVGCIFPGDLDPGDEVFEGVQFWVYNNARVVVDNQTVLHYVRLAMADHVLSHPTDQIILDRILEHSELT